MITINDKREYQITNLSKWHYELCLRIFGRMWNSNESSKYMKVILYKTFGQNSALKS